MCYIILTNVQLFTVYQTFATEDDVGPNPEETGGSSYTKFNVYTECIQSWKTWKSHGIPLFSRPGKVMEFHSFSRPGKVQYITLTFACRILGQP